jgi:superfamily II DNA or RNA helicase
LPCRQR